MKGGKNAILVEMSMRNYHQRFLYFTAILFQHKGPLLAHPDAALILAITVRRIFLKKSKPKEK